MADSDAPRVLELSNELSGGHGYVSLTFSGGPNRYQQWSGACPMNRRRERLIARGSNPGDVLSRMLRTLEFEKEKREGKA